MLERIKKHWDISLITCLGIFIHIIPFFLFSEPLGYDTGFYRRFLLENSGPLTLVPGLGNDAIVPKIILYLCSLTGIQESYVLYASYIFLYSLIVVALFFLIKKYTNHKTAIIVSLIFVISPISYIGYWFMLYKNAIGTLILLLLCINTEKISKTTYILMFMLMFSHQTSSIIFLISLFIYLIYRKKIQKENLYFGIVSMGLYLAIHGINFQKIYENLPVADFIPWYSYLVFSLPVILLALVGIKNWYTHFRKTFFFIFCVVSISYPILHLPFYERIFIFSDIAIISIAGFGVSNLLTNTKNIKIKKIFVVILIVSTLFILINRISKLSPLLSSYGLREVKSLGSNLPRNSYVLTSTNLAPWVVGFTTAHVVAPGMFNDTYSQSDWIQYWNEEVQENKESFVKTLPSPLYLFIQPEFYKSFAPTNCTNKITDFFSQIDCHQNKKL